MKSLKLIMFVVVLGFAKNIVVSMDHSDGQPWKSHDLPDIKLPATKEEALRDLKRREMGYMHNLNVNHLIDRQSIKAEYAQQSPESQIESEYGFAGDDEGTMQLPEQKTKQQALDEAEDKHRIERDQARKNFQSEREDIENKFAEDEGDEDDEGDAPVVKKIKKPAKKMLEKEAALEAKKQAFKDRLPQDFKADPPKGVGAKNVDLIADYMVKTAINPEGLEMRGEFKQQEGFFEKKFAKSDEQKFREAARKSMEQSLKMLEKNPDLQELLESPELEEFQQEATDSMDVRRSKIMKEELDKLVKSNKRWAKFKGTLGSIMKWVLFFGAIALGYEIAEHKKDIEKYGKKGYSWAKKNM